MRDRCVAMTGKGTPCRRMQAYGVLCIQHYRAAYDAARKGCAYCAPDEACGLHRYGVWRP